MSTSISFTATAINTFHEKPILTVNSITTAKQYGDVNYNLTLIIGIIHPS